MKAAASNPTHPIGLSERLAAAMAAKGMTTAELARAVGFTYQAIRKLETGASKDMMAGHVFAVSDALGVSARWMATGKGAMKDGQAAMASPAITRIAEALEGLDEEGRRALLVVLDRLATGAALAQGPDDSKPAP